MKERGRRIVDALRQDLLDKFIAGRIGDEEFKTLMDLMNDHKAKARYDQTPPKPYNAVIEPKGD